MTTKFIAILRSKILRFTLESAGIDGEMMLCAMRGVAVETAETSCRA